MQGLPVQGSMTAQAGARCGVAGWSSAGQPGKPLEPGADSGEMEVTWEGPAEAAGGAAARWPWMFQAMGDCSVHARVMGHGGTVFNHHHPHGSCKHCDSSHIEMGKWTQW